VGYPRFGGQLRMAGQRFDLHELRERVRRRGLLGVLVEGPRPRSQAGPEAPGAPAATPPADSTPAAPAPSEPRPPRPVPTIPSRNERRPLDGPVPLDPDRLASPAPATPEPPEPAERTDVTQPLEPPVAPPPPEPTDITQRLESPVAPPEPAPAKPSEPDPVLLARLRDCTIGCTSVITALADLPSLELGGEAIEVALLRLRLRRPEGETDVCVRQHIPEQIRGLLGPGSRVMALAHEADPRIAIVDWTATGAWIGADLTFPDSPQQYDWPERAEWPAAGQIEIHDVNGQSEELNQRRGEWRFTSADLLALTPLPSRVDSRDEWRITLDLRDGNTVAIKDRVPLLALARLRPDDTDRVGTPIDVLLSQDGELAIDWESTLRQPELRSRAT